MSSVTSPVYYGRRLRQYLSDLWGRREFAWYLAMGNLKARNASTALGLFWWVLNPLLLGLVYFFIFGFLFQNSKPDDYLSYLLSGMFVFHFTHQSMTGGANSILQNSKLLVNLKFPRMVLLLSAVTESAIGFFTSIAVFFVIAGIADGTTPSRSIVWLAAIVPIQITMNIGLGALVARLAVPFRDITNFLPYVTRLWLYMTPIIWPLTRMDSAGDTLKTFVNLNPMYHVISVYRTALLGYPMSLHSLATAAAWAVGFLIVGAGSFVSYESRLVRYL